MCDAEFQQRCNVFFGLGCNVSKGNVEMVQEIFNVAVIICNQLIRNPDTLNQLEWLVSSLFRSMTNIVSVLRSS